MRIRFVRAAVAVAIAGGTTLAIAYSTGPPVSRTGALGVGGIPSEGLCTSCHLTYANDVNDPAGQLQILGVPDQYQPGSDYPITVRLAYTHPPTDVNPPLWGFELTTARADSGLGAGTFTYPSELQVKAGTFNTAWKSRLYIEHTSAALREGDPGPVEWNFTWTAPGRDVGKVYFFAAGNAANGDGNNTGDHIFTAMDSTAGDTATVAVPRQTPLGYSTVLDAIHPNPFARFCDMSFSIARSGTVDLGVFDLQGRRVYTVFHGQHAAGFSGGQWEGVRQDGHPAPNGVYFIKLMAPGLQQPLSQKVTLAR